MLIGVDVGNTNITIARLDGDQVADRWRLSIDTPDIETELDEAIGLDRVTNAVMASVVPAISATLTAAFARRGIPLVEVDVRSIPMSVRVDRPDLVGADRLVNAFAAARLYGAPAIVVDLGTATTFDVVDAEGAFIGGAIAPGLELGLDALAERTALLPRVEPVAPRHVIGTDTVSAIQSGAVIGYIGLVRELTSRMRQAVGQQAKVILTGGLSQAAWARQIPNVDAIDPDLTLRGLAMLHSEIGSSRQATTA